ncbi:MAG: hypothetical protein IMY73_02915 [Bacteroidetes bacterium]|nr:hypothetical protein [Bacteroidota bacterium]
MKIKIGADELILWLRKNNIAKETPNDEINGLGIKIFKIIENLNGAKIESSQPCVWSTKDNSITEKYNLPKTSAQYEIETNKLPELYEKLSNL